MPPGLRWGPPLRMRLLLAGAILAVAVAAGCTGQHEEEAVPYCASYLPPGTACIEVPPPSARRGGIEEPVIVEEPVETDYEGPRVSE